MLKKNIKVELKGEEYVIPIDFSLIEKIESVYDRNVDYILAYVFTDFKSITLSKIVEIFTSIFEGKLSAKDVKEAIYGMETNKIKEMVLHIQSACFFMRKMLSEEDLKKILESKEEKEVADEQKKDGSLENGQKNATP